MEDQVLKLAQEITGLEGEEEALFAFWVHVGNKYADLIQGTNSREDTIEMSIEALEENMHN